VTPFVSSGHPARVVFGPGRRRELATEVKPFGARVFLIGNDALVDEALGALGAAVAGAITDVVMHVPIERAAQARTLVKALGVDVLVALGGGSAVGLAKAVSLELGLPIVAVPTTFAGSEMTSIWGLTECGEKRTGRDERVRPKTVIYDPELVTSMPKRLAAASGLNALAHSMEALYAPAVDPIVVLLAEESVRVLAASLPAVVEGGSASAFSDSLYGAWLAGVALDRATVGLHHKLCHTLGGSFGLPHAETHAVVLPHSAKYNEAAAPEAFARMRRALGTDDVAGALFALLTRLELPTSLGALGLKATDLERVVELATRVPYPNPRPIEADELRLLLGRAFRGEPPQPTSSPSSPFITRKEPT
jgi:maleylacetate reductase